MSVLLREDWMSENLPPIDEEWPTHPSSFFFNLSERYSMSATLSLVPQTGTPRYLIG
jgi:hypothetical protein